MGILLIVAVLAACLAMLRRRQQREHSERRRQLQASRERLAARQQQLDEEGGKLRGRLATLRASLAEIAAAGGVEIPRDAAELHEAATAWRAQHDELTHWLAAKQQRQLAHARCDELAAAAREAEDGLQHATQSLRRQIDAWYGWLAKDYAAEPSGPWEFAAVLQSVKEARDALRRLEDARHELTRIEDRLAYIRRQLGNVVQQCGWEDKLAADEIAALDDLSDSLARAVENDKRHRRLTASREQIEVELGRLQRQMAQKQENLDRLLREAGAETEEAFRRIAGEFEQWQRSKLAGDEQEITLRTLAGSPAAWSQLKRELESTAPAELSDQQERLAAERAQLQIDLATDEREIREIEHELEGWVAADQTGEKRQELATVQAHLDAAVRVWAVRAVCRSLLAAARATFEHDRLPQVMRRAGEYLDILTAGRYRFVRSLGEQVIVLENAEGDRLEEPGWSGAVSDHVQLAVRLGLARELAGRAEPLPVVLDDVFVRVDPTRHRDAARLLLHFAAGQQVLLLTSRTEFARLVGEVHQQDNLSHVAVAYYDITDGAIQRREQSEKIVEPPKGVTI
jgi:uncharacterized protein YhaN